METMEVDGESANNTDSMYGPNRAAPKTTTIPLSGTTESMERSEDINALVNQDAFGASTQSMMSSVNVMADPSTVASVTISLHPLVIMNISEHWTRLRAQAGEFLKVYGALIGKQKGRNIEVMNSFELKIDCIGNDLIVNRDYYNTKESQYKQVSKMHLLTYFFIFFI